MQRELDKVKDISNFLFDLASGQDVHESKVDQEVNLCDKPNKKLLTSYSWNSKLKPLAEKEK